MNYFMSALKILQALLILIGIGGVAYAFRKQRRQSSVIVVPLVLTGALLVFLLCETLPFLYLKYSGQNAQAVVSGLDCLPGKKHHIHYRFKINGVPVDGLSPDGYGNMTCDSLRINDIGLILYIYKNPEINVWGNPDVYIKERALVGLFIALFAPVLIYFGYIGRAQK